MHRGNAYRHAVTGRWYVPLSPSGFNAQYPLHQAGEWSHAAAVAAITTLDRVLLITKVLGHLDLETSLEDPLRDVREQTSGPTKLTPLVRASSMSRSASSRCASLATNGAGTEGSTRASGRGFEVTVRALGSAELRDRGRNGHLDVIEQPHEQAGGDDHLGCVRWIVELDLAVSGWITKQAKCSREQLHERVLLARWFCLVAKHPRLSECLLHERSTDESVQPGQLPNSNLNFPQRLQYGHLMLTD